MASSTSNSEQGLPSSILEGEEEVNDYDEDEGHNMEHHDDHQTTSAQQHYSNVQPMMHHHASGYMQTHPQGQYAGQQHFYVQQQNLSVGHAESGGQAVMLGSGVPVSCRLPITSASPMVQPQQIHHPQQQNQQQFMLPPGQTNTMSNTGSSNNGNYPMAGYTHGMEQQQQNQNAVYYVQQQPHRNVQYTPYQQPQQAMQYHSQGQQHHQSGYGSNSMPQYMNSTPSTHVQHQQNQQGNAGMLQYQNPQHQRHYLPTVGSNCTVMTSDISSPTTSAINSQDVYDFNAMDTEEVVSGVEEYRIGHYMPQEVPPQVTHQQQPTYTVRVIHANSQQRPTTSSSEAPYVQQAPLPRRMAVPQFEEEEEEEDEEICIQQNQPQIQQQQQFQQQPIRQVSVTGGSVGQSMPVSVQSQQPIQNKEGQNQSDGSGEMQAVKPRQSRKQQLPNTCIASSSSLTVTMGGKPINLASSAAPTKQSKPAKTSKDQKTTKKEETPAIDKDAASNAKAQAVQRFSSSSGWKRMNEWLKTAEKSKDLSKLKTLLSQCLEANVTTELLLSNDTPKVIHQLSRTSKDKEIADMASNLVQKWKKVVKTGDANSVTKRRSSSEKLDDKKAENTLLTSKPGASAGKKSPPLQVVHPQTEVSILDKVTEEMSSDPLKKQQEQPAIPRPKTAKAKVSKPRSTGLEGDDNTLGSGSNLATRRKIPTNTVRPLAPVKAPPATAASGIPLAATSPTATTKTAQASVKRSIMLSDSFMSALESAHETAPKKPKIVRKKLNPIQPSSATSSTSSFESTLFADLTKSTTPETKNIMEMDHAPSTTDSAFSGEGVAPGRRRVSFADERGQDLTEVKFFEIEEGERVNVSKMSSEDMKHLEMQREKNVFREQKGFHMSSLNLPMPQGYSGHTYGTHERDYFSNNASRYRWKLIPVDGATSLIEAGCQSETKIAEIKRWATEMEALCLNPDEDKMEMNDLPESEVPRSTMSANYEPKIIPLELLGAEDSTQTNTDALPPPPAPKTSAPSTSAAARIQQLPLPLQNPADIVAALPPSLAALLGTMDVSNVKKEDTKIGDEKDKQAEIAETPISPTSPESPPPFDSKSAIEEESSPEGPDSPEDLDIRRGKTNEVEDTDIRSIPMAPIKSDGSDGDTDIRGKVQEDKKDDLKTLMENLKKSGVFDKVPVPPSSNAPSSSNAISPAMFAAITNVASKINSSTSTASPQPGTSQASTTSTTQQPPPGQPRMPIGPPHGFGIPPPNMLQNPQAFLQRFQAMRMASPPMPGFLPPNFTAPPPSSQFAAQVANAALAAASAQQRPRMTTPHIGGPPGFLPPFNGPPPSTSQSGVPPVGILQSIPVPSDQKSSDRSNADGGSSTTAGAQSLPGFSTPANATSATSQEGHPPATDDQNRVQNEIEMVARTFVKHCSYYANGGCHYGESCRFAHGDEITSGVRQAMHSIQRGRGGFRGRGRGGPPFGRGGGEMRAIGGGLEIDFDEREGRVRTWQIPPTLVSDSRMGRGRGRGRFTSPLRRSTYDDRHRSHRRRRSRSSSTSISPIRAANSRNRKSRSRSRSRSRSPRRSDRRSDRDSHRSSGGHRRRRRSPSPSEGHRKKRSPSPSRRSSRRTRSRTPDERRSKSKSSSPERRTRSAGEGSRKSSRGGDDASSSGTPIDRLEVADPLGDEPAPPGISSPIRDDEPKPPPIIGNAGRRRDRHRSNEPTSSESSSSPNSSTTNTPPQNDEE
ncbi:TFIIS helical bundle-like domain-containing protein [Ditylenchus destructor]|uniref:TFIIS helical bundle-like domain-containing protein n=1 Tax=Ditylenchus destructor TaxID=166010 RepID=A0AAD4NAP7_9BILA|nr:TFIIS helical bundle-like domain-containing protein [Ditylenchus destructor]